MVSYIVRLYTATLADGRDPVAAAPAACERGHSRRDRGRRTTLLLCLTSSIRQKDTLVEV